MFAFCGMRALGLHQDDANINNKIVYDACKQEHINPFFYR